MVEHDEAVVKADAAVRQFEIVHRPPRNLRLDKILQIVTPVAETPAERKRQIDFVEHFITRHQSFEQAPRIPELDMNARFSLQLAASSDRTESEKRPRRDERIARLRPVKQCA